MKGGLKLAKIHIVMNGVGEEFNFSVSKWSQNGEVKGNGNSVMLIIDEDDLSGIRKRLENHDEPEGFCEATIPPVDGEYKVYIGKALKDEIERIEKSPGRHIKLSALPSELAKMKNR